MSPGRERTIADMAQTCLAISRDMKNEGMVEVSRRVLAALNSDRAAHRRRARDQHDLERILPMTPGCYRIAFAGSLILFCLIIAGYVGNV